MKSDVNPHIMQARIDELKEVRSHLIQLISSPNAEKEKHDTEFKKISSEISSIKQMLETALQSKIQTENMDRELEEIIESLSAENLKVKEFDNTLVHKLIECVRVNSEFEITVIFKGGVEVKGEVGE